MKLKIIEKVTMENHTKDIRRVFKIKTKNKWWWSDIFKSNGLKANDIEFAKYSDAEDYIYNNLLPNGSIEKNGNLYIYNQYCYSGY